MVLLSHAWKHCKGNFGDDTGFCGLSVGTGGCLFLREKMAVGISVCFSFICLASSEKKKAFCSVCRSWICNDI